jgi:hypothetical protein
MMIRLMTILLDRLPEGGDAADVASHVLEGVGIGSNYKEPLGVHLSPAFEVYQEFVRRDELARNKERESYLLLKGLKAWERCIGKPADINGIRLSTHSDEYQGCFYIAVAVWVPSGSNDPRLDMEWWVHDIDRTPRR